MHPKELAARSRRQARQLPAEHSESTSTSIALQRPLCKSQNETSGRGQDLPAVIQVLNEVATGIHRDSAVKGM